MKKLALATILVLASITVSAQVAVYGNLRSFLDNTNVSSNSSTTMKSDSSRIGISASEVLSGGLTARAVVETSIAATNPVSGTETKLGDRQTTLGLSSQIGSINIGRKFNSHFLAITYGSIAGDVHSLRTIRSGDAVFLNAGINNFSGSFDRTVTVGTEALSYSLVGLVGPVQATVAVFESGQSRSTVVAGQSGIRGVKAHVSYSLDKDNAVESTGSLVGLGWDMGSSVTTKVSYGVRSLGDVRAYNLGADYALSKNTAISVAYRNVLSSETRQLGAGLTHRF